MNIGDKVRLFRSREEGIITKFLDDNTVEIAIEGDFRIPVLRKEIVVVSRQEDMVFGNVKDEAAKSGAKGSSYKAAQPKEEIIATQGFYMAFVPVNDRVLNINIINNTDLDIPFTFGQEEHQVYKGLFTGVLKKRSSILSEEVQISTFEKWPVYVFQLLFHKQGVHTLKQPMVRKIRFKANTFFKSKRSAPVINKDAYLFQVDNEHAVDLKPEEIVEKIFTGKEVNRAGAPATTVAPPLEEIDLHIEALVPDHVRMSNAEILNLQLETFEKALDAAIASGMSEITFIHGVGNGTLRNEIHKRLGKNAYIGFYQDARKEKFGYGATLVKLK
jgi:hypothetical protein